MTCRQAINRPLPVSNGIHMRDYADRDEKLAGRHPVVEITLDFIALVMVNAVVWFGVGYFFGGLS